MVVRRARSRQVHPYTTDEKLKRDMSIISILLRLTRLCYFVNPDQVDICLQTPACSPFASHTMAQLLNSPALAPPEWLENLAAPVAQAIGLPKLAGVVHIAAAACAASFALQFASHVVSPALFPKTYPKIRGKQDDWDLHVVSGRQQRCVLGVGVLISLTLCRSAGPTQSSQHH